jgi:hypothetical protein
MLKKIILNHNNEVSTFYRVASSDEQALMFAIWALEEELGLIKGSLKNYFAGKKNSWEVSDVKK